jgi:hypothetical protein
MAPILVVKTHLTISNHHAETFEHQKSRESGFVPWLQSD